MFADILEGYVLMAYELIGTHNAGLFPFGLIRASESWKL